MASGVSHSSLFFLQELMHRKPNNRMIEMLVFLGRQLLPCTNSSPHSIKIPSLHIFLTQLAINARVKTSTLLVSLLYLSRVKNSLPPTAQGMQCTIHRIIIACFISADKYLHDTPLRNKSWAGFSSYFSLAEVNLMERQLLCLLHYNIQVNDADLASLVGHCYAATTPAKEILNQELNLKAKSESESTEKFNDKKHHLKVIFSRGKMMSLSGP